MTLPLFDTTSERGRDAPIVLGPGAILLRGYTLPAEEHLLDSLAAVIEESPLRHMETPGGHRMSVAMTNCGELGWVSSRSGYRYSKTEPETGKVWPPMPEVFFASACSAADRAGFAGFVPNACLVNRYDVGARLTLHQDKNEGDFAKPIVSFSLGLPATFLFGGEHRSDPVTRIGLQHGDVVVWGGPSRLWFHGIAPIKRGHHPQLGSVRYNLTFRFVR